MKTPTSRPFENQHDFEQMQDLLMEARSLTNDWRYSHVGELAFNYFMVAIHLDPQGHIRLWHDDGKLVGYAILGEDPAFDWQVLPAYEWSGIELEAFMWAEARTDELRKQDEKRWSGDLVSGSREDDINRIAFLEQHGFQYCGDLAEVNMMRSLDEPIPESRLPDGYQVREVLETGEITNRASIQREVWHPWTVGKVSDDDYTRFMQLPGYHRDLDIVSVAPNGVIAAYVNGWIDPLNKIGDFGPVGALEAYRKQGLTRAALLEGLRRMKAYGMSRVCVSTGVSNAPAKQLYESIGFKIVNRYLDYVKLREKQKAG
ncbi:MAG: GNAT family N-acetyltransferase [Anaerolineales bacterium]|jgi:ribosomal protein S18 acetylase RimI-like enzyme|nr:GNAT family N-acetyltransferase [Anaerolineales bacterium]RPI68722.1 MAG: GNAT family N-acetyltransferase [Geobacteraceae bacterium]